MDFQAERSEGRHEIAHAAGPCLKALNGPFRQLSINSKLSLG